MDDNLAGVITLSVFLVCGTAIAIAWIIWGRD